MNKVLIDVEKLRECAEKGMSQLEMAVHFDTSCSVIYARMKENGIKGKACRPSKYNREQLIRYLQQGFTAGKIAEILDVNPTTVSSWIKRYDLGQYQRIPRRQKDDCRTCIYRERVSGTAGKCNYLSITGHSRNKGQPEEICSKYVRGEKEKRQS